MTNRERAMKALSLAYSYQWKPGSAPALEDLEQYADGRGEIELSITDLLTDLRHWAKLNGIDFKNLLEASEQMFREETALNCQACALEHEHGHSCE